MFGYFSGFGVLAVLFLAWALASTPILKAADSTPTKVTARVSTLDGLRGFLALAVFLQHTAIMHGEITHASWILPPSRLLANLGQAGVAVFFMITGFLFWGQSLKRSGRMDYVHFIVSRLFRLLPLYWVLIILAFAISIAAAGFRINGPPIGLLKSAVKCSAGGYVWCPYPINAVPESPSLVGQLWTLHYEWLFYASMLILWHLGRRPILSYIFSAIILVAALIKVWMHTRPGVSASPAECALLFSIGTCAACLRHAVPALHLRHWMFSAATSAAFCGALFGFNNETTAFPTLLLGVGFFFIVFGTDIFGLLSTKGAKRLGDVSYGIYLLQGVIQTTILLTPAIATFDTFGPASHWTLVVVASIILVIIATLAHVAVERPGVSLGSRAIKRFREILQPRYSIPVEGSS